MSSDLERRLERLGKLLTNEVESWERSTRDQRRRVVRQLADQVEAAIDKSLGERDERRLARKRARLEERRLKRQAQREERRENASLVGGGFLLLAALVCLGIALTHLEFWWLIFVAFGTGSGGAQQVALALEKARLQRGETSTRVPSVSELASPAAKHEVDALCDGLLAELKQSPEAVRSFLQNPEKTVESLRLTCKALDARRQQLLAQDARGQRVLLEQRRQELTAKRDAATDSTARAKLEEALGSLGQQDQALKQLTAMTERVDGEYVSLLVLLQEMRTRVTVARSAGSEAQLQALRTNVQRLNSELEAITSAVEEVQRSDVQPVSPVEGPGSGSKGLGTRER